MKKAAAVFAAVMLLSAAGCREDDGRDYPFVCNIPSNPVTLDPQIADGETADLVIQNIFTGLLALAEDGSVKDGVAADFVVSDDGLTYTFKLKQGIYWTDGGDFEEQCTAKDFVYGFTRLFLPETGAPRAEDYYCIKNAQLLHTGKITDPSLLGVKAKGDFELEITLEYPDPRFLTKLTETPAMPCSEKFFLQSQGKYGLSGECTPSNGAFYIRRWLYDPDADQDSNNIILGRHSKNAETMDVCPSTVTIFIRDKELYIDDFNGGDISCLSVSESERGRIKSECEEFATVTCGIAFNRRSTLFRNNDFRMALALLVDRDAALTALSGYVPAEGIVPAEVSMLDKGYRELVGGTQLGCDPDEARRHYLKAEPNIDKSLFTGAKVIVSDSAAATAVSYAMQEWQREYGFYCVVEQLNGDDYRAALESGDFDIAVLELTGRYNSPSAYLEQFRAGSADNLTGFANAEFETLLTQAERTADLSESAEIYKRAEEKLIENAAFVPLYCKNEYFFTKEGCTDIVYEPFSGTVDFARAKKFD